MPQGERSGKEGSGVPRGQRKEAGARKRERSRVRRSAESPGGRERLERDRERRAAESPGDSAARLSVPRGLRCSPFSPQGTPLFAFQSPGDSAARLSRFLGLAMATLAL